jgi:thiol-disulfide isomerase/thioredoxin
MYKSFLYFILSFIIFSFVIYTGKYGDEIKVTSAILIYFTLSFYYLYDKHLILKTTALYTPNLIFLCYLLYSIYSNHPVRFHENLIFVLSVPFSLILGYALNNLLKFQTKKTFIFFLILVVFTSLGYIGQINHFNYLLANSNISKLPEAINLYERTGKKISREDWDNKIIVFDVWARTCGNCIEKMPEFNDFFKRYKNDKEVLIYSLYLPIKNDADGIKYIWFNKLNYEFPIIFSSMDFKSFSKTLDFNGVPLIIIINKKGNIIYKGDLNFDKLDFVYNTHSIINEEKKNR